MRNLVERYEFVKEKVHKGFRYIMITAFIVGCIFSNEFGLSLLDNLWVVVVVALICFLIDIRLLLLVVFFSLGILRVNYVTYSPNHVSRFVDRYVTLEATVSAYPYTKGLDKVILLKPKSISLDDNPDNIKIDGGLVQIRLARYIDLDKGDRVKLKLLLEKPENFDDFDYTGYLKSNNIYALGKNPRILEITANEEVFTSNINNIRNGILSRINSYFPDPHAKLLAGMLIGTREQFSLDFANKLSISGTTHIVAVSGYNISLIINAVLSLAGFFNRRLLIKVSYIGLIIFIMIVGVDNIPALRATLMGFVLLSSMSFGRRSSGLFILLLVAMIFHLQNPFTYRSLSFQLSFSATLGLMLLSTNLRKLTRFFVPTFLQEELATTLSAIVITFPITFANFGKVTFYSLLANILVAPLIPLISFLGIAWLLLSWLGIFVEPLLRGPLWGSLEVLVLTVDKVSSLPYAGLVFTSYLPQIAVLFLLVIIILILEFSYLDFKSKRV